MTYTVDQLYGKLERADAAGDAEAAKVIASEIRRMEGGATAKPKPSPKPMSAWDQIKRTAGMGARAVVSGPLEFAGIFTDPIALSLGLGTARQGAQGAGDALGLPNPVNGAERVSLEASKAITGGLPMIGLGRSLSAAPGVAGGVGELLASRPATQVASAGMGAASAGAAREGGAGTGGQVAAGLVGGLAPGGITYGGSAGLRFLARGGEKGREAMEKGIADFHAIGAEPSVGQATGNRRMQGLESLLAGGPTSTGVMSRFAERQADQIGAGLQSRAASLSPAPSAERAGLAVQRGVQTFKGNVEAQRDAFYWQADKLIPSATVSPLSNTWQSLRALTTPNPGAPNTTAAMINPKIANLFETVGQDLAKSGGKGLPYNAVKEIRSKIGAELADFSLTTDKPTAQYKALYAALSRDMEDVARQQGPAAYEAAKLANKFYLRSQNRLEALERVVDKAGGPEKVYLAAMSGTQDGATTLRKVMNSIPPESQRAMTAAVVKRMGLATKGNQNDAGDVFSAQTFLTKWNELSPQAKGALFGPHAQTNARFVSDMDKIARVASRIKDGSKVFANPSGTANKGAAYTYAGSLGVAFLSGQFPAFAALVGSGVAANAGARLMTNPRFVSWLARTTDVPVSALPQQAQMLKQIAAQEKDAEMAALADSLTQKR